MTDQYGRQRIDHRSGFPTRFHRQQRAASERHTAKITFSLRFSASGLPKRLQLPENNPGRDHLTPTNRHTHGTEWLQPAQMQRSSERKTENGERPTKESQPSLTVPWTKAAFSIRLDCTGTKRPVPHRNGTGRSTFCASRSAIRPLRNHRRGCSHNGCSTNRRGSRGPDTTGHS